MAFSPVPTDANGVPVSSGYKPESGNFYAIQSSLRTVTDTASNTYAPPVMEVVNQEYIRRGLTYIATTGRLATATNSNLLVGASLFNPTASAKTLLVVSARAMQIGASSDIRLNLVSTTDPQLGAPTTLTITNLLPGGNASALAGLSPVPVTSSAAAASTSVTASGTQIDSAMLPAGGAVEFIPNGFGLLLPVTYGLAMFQVIITAGQFYAFTFKWVEY